MKREKNRKRTKQDQCDLNKYVSCISSLAKCSVERSPGSESDIFEQNFN